MMQYPKIKIKSGSFFSPKLPMNVPDYTELEIKIFAEGTNVYPINMR
jgi:hypothetical protein